MSLDEICHCQLASCTAIKFMISARRSRGYGLKSVIQTRNHLFVVMDDVEAELGTLETLKEILDQKLKIV